MKSAPGLALIGSSLLIISMAGCQTFRTPESESSSGTARSISGDRVPRQSEPPVETADLHVSRELPRGSAKTAEGAGKTAERGGSKNRALSDYLATRAGETLPPQPFPVSGPAAASRDVGKEPDAGTPE